MHSDITKRNMQMFEGASRAFGSTPGKPKEKAEPSAKESEIDQLKAELAALRDKVDRLGE
jgi:polyhydroxyalkanoate synthesis regulator protein